MDLGGRQQGVGLRDGSEVRRGACRPVPRAPHGHERPQVQQDAGGVHECGCAVGHGYRNVTLHLQSP